MIEEEIGTGMKNTTLIIIVVRAILIFLALYFGGKLIDNYKPRRDFLRKIWKDEMNIRKWLIQHAWLIASAYLAVHMSYVFLIG